jgi:hypothetical protein
MKSQLGCGLHLEFLQYERPGERLIAPTHGADVLFLAGDIVNGCKACKLVLRMGAGGGKGNRLTELFASQIMLCQNLCQK